MFVAAQGLDYRNFLAALHQQLRFDWYFEIGSQTGRSLARSQSPSIAVDPVFRFKRDVAGNKPALHLFQQTSDDFFAAGHLKTLKARPDFGFLDGMHLFEFLLRDFMNTEAAAKPTSAIALHDCCPFGHGMTTRDLGNIPRGAWTGDVWKLIPILQEYRPDLKIDVLDCAPTGLVVLTNLKPKSTVLRKNYDKIVARYRDMTLADFGVDLFYGSFAYVSAEEVVKSGFELFRPACRTFIPHAELKEPAPAAPVLAAPPAPEPVAQVLSKTTAHGVDLYSGHRVLRDLSHDLATCLSRPLPRGVDVYVGVHVVARPANTGRIRIGIQTEQYFDRQGKRMWRLPRPKFIQRYARFYDVLLDLSPDNAPAYASLPEDLRAKVQFGPHIFPEGPVEPDFQPTPPLFFGSLNQRRRELLADLQAQRPIEVAPHGTFGRALRALMAGQGGVVNLHYIEGEYSEYPRVLKAYLGGKVVLSEPLSPPLVAKIHYLDLDAKLTEAATRKIFKNLGDFAAAHSFQRFLEGVALRSDLQLAG